MEQTKPFFVIKKYRSILFAAVIIEGANYVVSLIDSVIAGNTVGEAALSAVGLVAPFLYFSVFLATIIYAGTVVNYSNHIGSFDKRRGSEFFSQGFFMALFSGLLYSGILFVFRDLILSRFSASPEVMEFTRDYYNFMLLAFMMNPISYLLESFMTTDDGEMFTIIANVFQILLNVVLSILFVKIFPERPMMGIALGSVIGKIVFVFIVSLHFLSKENTLKLVRYWNFKDCFTILKHGVVKASTYVLESVAVFIFNMFTIRYFGGTTLVLLVMVEKFLGLTEFFIGFSMSSQPMVGTLKGEGNFKALGALMKKVRSDMMVSGLILTVLTFIFTPFLVRMFGIHDTVLIDEGVTALRIVSSAFVLHALLSLFFIYYYLMDYKRLSLSLSVTKNVLSPVLFTILFSLIMKNQNGLWVGFAVSPLMTFLVFSQFIFKSFSKFGKGYFPFLLSTDSDENTFIYDFPLNEENAVDISRTVDLMLSSCSVSKTTRGRISLFLEEMLILVQEKNSGKNISTEVTFIIENPSEQPNSPKLAKPGVRLILRDSGIIFDITNVDSKLDSFRQYVVSNLMDNQKGRKYLLTTGYNRNELFFEDSLRGE